MGGEERSEHAVPSGLGRPEQPVDSGSAGWADGKSLRYTDGSSDPDTEGVTMTDAGPTGGIYDFDGA